MLDMVERTLMFLSVMRSYACERNTKKIKTFDAIEKLYRALRPFYSINGKNMDAMDLHFDYD
jgi:hypothetical protein